MNCTNCYAETIANYCSNCGQPNSLKRIDKHYIVHEIEHVLHFERGILHTIRELTINPGPNIQKYLTENRSRLVKPIIFIIVTSLIYTLFNQFFQVEDGYVKYHDAKPSTAGLIVKWVQNHYGYANIMMSIFIALWLKLFFKKYNYNFYEILIMLCFVLGMGMLILSIFTAIEGLTHFKIMIFGSVIGMIYTTWAIGHFFNKIKVSSYLKALAAYICGMITFWIIPIFVGAIIDFLGKH